MNLRYALIGLTALVAIPSFAAGIPEFSIIQTIPGPDGGWDYASVDSAARRLYVAHGDAVTVLNLDTMAITPKLLDGNRLHAVLPLADGKGLMTNGGADNATLFDRATGAVIATIPTGEKPDAAIFDPVSGLVMVMDGKAGDVTLVDPKTGASPGRIPVGGALEFAVADGRGKVFINIEDKGEMAVIDTAARKVVAHYPLPGCEEPSGLAIDSESGILVAACANQTALAIRAKDGSKVASLTIGSHPDAAIFDAKRKLFFIPCGGDGTLAVIAENDGAVSVAATVKTAIGARTGALDPKTGRLYLPTADVLPAQPDEKHKGFKPGTFRILVVGEK
jgi:DNA-binding beta-propeller fold protein YncE